VDTYLFAFVCIQILLNQYSSP